MNHSTVRCYIFKRGLQILENNEAFWNLCVGYTFKQEYETISKMDIFVDHWIPQTFFSFRVFELAVPCLVNSFSRFPPGLAYSLTFFRSLYNHNIFVSLSYSLIFKITTPHPHPFSFLAFFFSITCRWVSNMPLFMCLWMVFPARTWASLKWCLAYVRSQWI